MRRVWSLAICLAALSATAQSRDTASSPVPASIDVVKQGISKPGDCGILLPSQIRMMDCGLAATVVSALERSATLQRQFRRVADLQGIVYVVTSPRVTPTRKEPRGGLSHQVGVSGAICVLRITLVADEGDRAIATLAHELHHAIEVLEHPKARTEAAIGDLFRRIGVEINDGVFETTGAIRTQMVVMQELREARRKGRH